MSNKPMPWMKIRPDLLNDVRLLNLNDAQQNLFFKMFLLSGHLNAEGAFIQNGKELTPLEIAHLLRVSDPKRFEKDLQALRKAKLIKANGHGPYIADFKVEQINWLEKQKSDRDRQRTHRDSVTRDDDVTGDGSRDGHAPRTRPRTRIQNQTKNQTKKKTTTNQPSSSKGKGRGPSGGGGASKNGKKDLFSSFEGAARQTAEIMHPILTSSGLGTQKSLNLLSQVATRISPRIARETTLAALASVFDDEDVRNKPVVAAMRIESKQISPQYFKPAAWGRLPDEVLKAAGLERIAGRIREIEEEAE
jgi:hypothetical protein